MSAETCLCLGKPLSFSQYKLIKFLGIDATHGRFGEVKILRCKTCGRYWLHYFVEYESFRGSGRYFMGLITPEIAKRLSPDRAVEYLNSLDWHLYGGSYFFGKKGKATGQVAVDCSRFTLSAQKLLSIPIRVIILTQTMCSMSPNNDK